MVRLTKVAEWKKKNELQRSNDAIWKRCLNKWYQKIEIPKWPADRLIHKPTDHLEAPRIQKNHRKFQQNIQNKDQKKTITSFSSAWCAHVPRIRNEIFEMVFLHWNNLQLILHRALQPCIFPNNTYSVCWIWQKRTDRDFHCSHLNCTRCWTSIHSCRKQLVIAHSNKCVVENHVFIPIESFHPKLFCVTLKSVFKWIERQSKR